MIMASSNGLALKLPPRITSNDEDLRLHVLNPATKKSFLLPLFSLRERYLNVYYNQCGFAYSSTSMEYKVTVGVDKSWRHVELDHLPEHSRWILERYPVTTEGFVHWGRGAEILTLDVESEMIRVSEAPFDEEDWNGVFSHLSTGRYLTVLVGYRGFVWWEMTPQSGEWRKWHCDIDLEEPLRRFADESVDDLVPHGWVKYPESLSWLSEE